MSRTLAAAVLLPVISGCSLVMEPELGPIESGDTGGCAQDSDCDDSDSCTDDVCRENGCVHEPRDDDGDGFGRVSCGGNECNQRGSANRPAALWQAAVGAGQ